MPGDTYARFDHVLSGVASFVVLEGRVEELSDVMAHLALTNGRHKAANLIRAGNAEFFTLSEGLGAEFKHGTVLIVHIRLWFDVDAIPAEYVDPCALDMLVRLVRQSDALLTRTSGTDIQDLHTPRADDPAAGLLPVDRRNLGID